MEIKDIKNEIKRIEQLQFMNAMNDHWSADDVAFDRKCSEELRVLKAQLEEAEHGK